MDYNILEYVKAYVSSKVTQDDVVIDATAGNGHDTLFLASLARHVYAFDVQDAALKTTAEKLARGHYDNVTLINASHATLDMVVKEPIKVAVFNLGYLPNHDKTITTHIDSTLPAINKALDLCVSQGSVVITVYPGHAEGLEEARALTSYAKALESKHYSVHKYQFINRKQAPYNIIITKH